MLIQSFVALALLGADGDQSQAKPLSPQHSVGAKQSGAAAKAAPTASKSAKKKAAAFALLPVERKIIDLTNAERGRHGLPPLVSDPALVRSARNHAYWMASSRTLRHASGAWAENIAQGQTSAGHAVNSWMSSSGHRANILNRRHRRIGVAGYRSANGDIFWCQQFTE